MRRIQVEYENTCIVTYDPELARSLTESLIDNVIDHVYNERSRATIIVKHGRGAEDKINVEYSESRSDTIMFFDGFVIMPYEMDYKLIDILSEK